MLGIFTKLGISGGLGVLIGLVAVWWIKPTTEGGMVFIVTIVAISSVTAGGILSRFFAKKTTPSRVDSPAPPRLRRAIGQKVGGKRKRL